MKIQALKLFIELSNSESIRQAANRLNLAPTALSRQLDQMEHFFRAKLIDRSAEGIRLTEAGRLLLERARTISNDVETTRALVDDLRGLQHGRTTIRASGAVLAGLVAPAIAELGRLHPGLRFDVEVVSASDVVSGVAAGLADLGATLFSPDTAKVRICHSQIIAHAVVVSPSHPFATLSSVTIRQLATQKLAVPDTSFGLRQDLERRARAASVRLDPVFVTSSLDLQKELAVLGSAALILPPLCCRREIETGLLTAIPLAVDSAIETSLDICRAPHGDLTFSGQALLKSLLRHATAPLHRLGQPPAQPIH